MQVVRLVKTNSVFRADASVVLHHFFKHKTVLKLPSLL
jgi:hypothetical protein